MFEENEVESAVELRDDVVSGADVCVKDSEVKVDDPPSTFNEPNNLTSDSDPFELGPLINKKPNKVPNECQSVTPEFPPGFSPISEGQQASESIHNLSGGESFKHTGFSLLHRLEETIKVGMALGLNMEGCEKNSCFSHCRQRRICSE